jgi:hypothetical protein
MTPKFILIIYDMRDPCVILFLVAIDELGHGSRRREGSCRSGRGVAAEEGGSRRSGQEGELLVGEGGLTAVVEAGSTRPPSSRPVEQRRAGEQRRQGPPAAAGEGREAAWHPCSLRAIAAQHPSGTAVMARGGEGEARAWAAAGR